MSGSSRLPVPACATCARRREDSIRHGRSGYLLCEPCSKARASAPPPLAVGDRVLVTSLGAVRRVSGVRAGVVHFAQCLKFPDGRTEYWADAAACVRVAS